MIHMKKEYDRSEGKIADKIFQFPEVYSSIGRNALKNNIRIRSVDLNRIRHIEPFAFAGCTTLRQVNLRNCIRLGKGAFSNCVNLKSIQIPESLIVMEPMVFLNCKRLSEVTFCGTVYAVDKLEKESFLGCSSLKRIKIPRKIEVIGERAFYRCMELEEVLLPVSLKEIKREAFYQTGLKELELPEGLKKIGDSAFLKCKQLEYVRIPDTVEVIEKWAFHGCPRLKMLEIHQDLKQIGPWITNKSCTIRCKKGTKTEQYCKEYDIRCEYI
ncbi:hypothetical protein B5F53_02480 [Blautia sp. An249]|nr:hypothetical protein B5F53_02480 [Blautia sp. An249]